MEKIKIIIQIIWIATLTSLYLLLVSLLGLLCLIFANDDIYSI